MLEPGMPRSRTPPQIRFGCAAFTRTELIVLIAVLSILALMMALVIAPTRLKQQRRECVNNLKNIGLAFRVCCSDSSDRFPFDYSIKDGGTQEYTNVWQHFLALTNELSHPKILFCPASNKKTAVSWQTLADKNISYFIGITAAETYPQSILSGDTGFLIDGQPPTSNPISISPNFNGNIDYPNSIHSAVGNICMGDGSVQQLTANRLKQAVRNTGLDTNILLLPRHLE